MRMRGVHARGTSVISMLIRCISGVEKVGMEEVLEVIVREKGVEKGVGLMG